MVTIVNLSLMFMTAATKHKLSGYASEYEIKQWSLGCWAPGFHFESKKIMFGFMGKMFSVLNHYWLFNIDFASTLVSCRSFRDLDMSSIHSYTLIV